MQLPTDGAFQLGRGVRFAAITDGLSNTILVGEKHVPLQGHGQGWLDSSVYNGEYPVCYLRGAGMGAGIAQFLNEPDWKWGSYHTGVCLFAMCDGSVQALAKGTSPDTLMRMCQINDGMVVPEY